MIHEQLESLMILQDLDIMIREFEDQKTSSQMKKLGFPLNSAERLKKTRKEVASKIKPELLSHYEKLMAKFSRAIVPVKDGTCFGCFIIQPTMRVTGEEDEIKICERCQRFQYRL